MYDDNVIDVLKKNIADINNKKITYYDGFDIEVYASKENINKLKNNFEKRH